MIDPKGDSPFSADSPKLLLLSLSLLLLEVDLHRWLSDDSLISWLYSLGSRKRVYRSRSRRGGRRRGEFSIGRHGKISCRTPWHGL